MKKNLKKATPATELLPINLKQAPVINAFETDYKNAEPGTLTFIEGNDPGGLYACKASVVLVPAKLANILTCDESVCVVPSKTPRQSFDDLLERFS